MLHRLKNDFIAVRNLTQNSIDVIEPCGKIVNFLTTFYEPLY